MSLIKLQGNASGTGAFTIAAPNGNTDRTLTLPDATGTVLAAPAGAVTINSSAPSNSLTVDGSGNLGVGTSSPSYKIDAVLGSPSSSTLGWRMTTGNIGNLFLGLSQNSTNLGTASTSADIYTTAPLDLRFGTNSTERMRIDSSGNVGIGASSPSKKLHLAGTAGSSAILLAKTDSGASTLGQIGFSTVNGTVAGIDATAVTDSNNGSLRFWTTGGSPQSDVTSLSERARIDSAGHLLVGTTDFSNITGGNTAGIALQSAGTIWGSRADASGVFNRLTSNGSAVDLRRQGVTVGSISVTTTATTYNTSSDYRLKEDWQPMTGASERVLALKPVNFAWKVDGSRVDGFLAHEAQEIVPEAVTGAKDEVDDEGNPKYQGIDQSKLVPLLTAALQEALAEIANLKTRLTALEAN